MNLSNLNMNLFIAGRVFAGQSTTWDAGPHLQVQWKGKQNKFNKMANKLFHPHPQAQ